MWEYLGFRNTAKTNNKLSNSLCSVVIFSISVFVSVASSHVTRGPVDCLPQRENKSKSAVFKWNVWLINDTSSPSFMMCINKKLIKYIWGQQYLYLFWLNTSKGLFAQQKQRQSELAVLRVVFDDAILKIFILDFDVNLNIMNLRKLYVTMCGFLLGYQCVHNFISILRPQCRITWQRNATTAWMVTTVINVYDLLLRSDIILWPRGREQWEKQGDRGHHLLQKQVCTSMD